MKRPHSHKTSSKPTRQTKRISRHVDRLYNAVANYVKRNGGKLMVIGGIEIQEWPNEPEFVFRVAVKCCGRKPKYVKP